MVGGSYLGVSLRAEDSVKSLKTVKGANFVYGWSVDPTSVLQADVAPYVRKERAAGRPVTADVIPPRLPQHFVVIVIAG